MKAAATSVGLNEMDRWEDRDETSQVRRAQQFALRDALQRAASLRQRGAACDLVLQHPGVDDHGLLTFTGSRSAKGFHGIDRIPLLEDVDPIQINRVSGEVKVEATFGGTRSAGHLDALMRKFSRSAGSTFKNPATMIIGEG